MVAKISQVAESRRPTQNVGSALHVAVLGGGRSLRQSRVAQTGASCRSAAGDVWNPQRLGIQSTSLECCSPRQDTGATRVCVGREFGGTQRYIRTPLFEANLYSFPTKVRNI